MEEKKIGRSLLSGCGIFLATFVIVTICCALTFFLFGMNSGSYGDSLFMLNLILPPIVGLLVAFAAGVWGFVRSKHGKIKNENGSDAGNEQ